MNISRRQFLQGRVSLDTLSNASIQRADLEAQDNLRIAISSDCLAFNHIACRSCQDICESRAIRFQLQIGKPALPSIDDDACHRCGECVPICPSQAIKIEPSNNVGEKA